MPSPRSHRLLTACRFGTYGPAARVRELGQLGNWQQCVPVVILLDNVPQNAVWRSVSVWPHVTAVTAYTGWTRDLKIDGPRRWENLGEPAEGEGGGGIKRWRRDKHAWSLCRETRRYRHNGLDLYRPRKLIDSMSDLKYDRICGPEGAQRCVKPPNRTFQGVHTIVRIVACSAWATDSLGMGSCSAE